MNPFETVAMDEYQPISFQKRVYRARPHSPNMVENVVRKAECKRISKAITLQVNLKTHKNLAEITCNSVSFFINRYFYLVFREKCSNRVDPITTTTCNVV